MYKFILSSFIFLISSCTKDYPHLDTVPYVDVPKYMGTWYEIANIPNSFQKNCTGTTAHYHLDSDGDVRVVNKCFKFKLDGEETIAKGTAKVVDTQTNSKLKVSFFWPFFGDYWIIDLAPDYAYAVVASPSREYLWILNRTPTMEESVYQNLMDVIKNKGFDISKIKKTLQFNNQPKKPQPKQ
jgi:apolipoprotein D and lipocalin family protein